MRGSRWHSRHLNSTSRSIPACAGEPRLPAGVDSRDRVYPRVCGGATPFSGFLPAHLGLSPRVRGSRRAVGAGVAGLGSIPACAGEPAPSSPRRRMASVYPRVCGGARPPRRRAAADRGLSPRVRGSRAMAGRQIGPTGSIPACAGEPGTIGRRLAFQSVYPRVCGGAACPPLRVAQLLGLSPRVRGSHGVAARAGLRGGSIPACAGEPRFS